MRKLKLVVLSRSGALPIVILAAVAPTAAGACGSRSGLLEPSAAEGPDSGAGVGGAFGGSGGQGGSGFGGSGGVGGFGGFGGTGGSVTGGSGGMGGTGGNPLCPQPSFEETYEVPLPPEGVPATPGQICSVNVVPVESGLAARVTLTKLGSGTDLQAAQGFCEVVPMLEPRVIGNPVIEVIDSTYPALMQMQVSNLQKQPGGWSFQASFPGPLTISPDGFGRMTVRISLELDCSPQAATKVVHAATDIHVCKENDNVEWVSSGDACTVCSIIAEMAPSPIVPDKVSDDLPLARVLRLRLVELARISNTLVLLAEHDGGEGLEYEWHPSAGRVEKLAPDVVAWTLEEGMAAPFIHAAVFGPSVLAVASYGFNEAA